MRDMLNALDPMPLALGPVKKAPRTATPEEIRAKELRDFETMSDEILLPYWFEAACDRLLKTTVFLQAGGAVRILR
jgi:hypothetical protein